MLSGDGQKRDLSDMAIIQTLPTLFIHTEQFAPRNWFVPTQRYSHRAIVRCVMVRAPVC
jgi:hypothetical protein